jgi:hypothetical protein
VSILALPLVILGGFLMLLDRFDKTINITEYQELIRKGLYVSNEELEGYIDRANKLMDRRGIYPESMKYIKEVVKEFATKEKNITSLQYKDEDSYEVIFDKEKHYLLTKNNKQVLKDELKLVFTKDGKDSFYQEEKKQHFYLYEYSKE